MDAIKAMWTNGQIVPSEPVEWPEGSELRVEKVPSNERIGLDEAEWQDSPAALADWENWIKTIEPLELSDEERATTEQFRADVRRASVEAVRRQMGL